MKLKCILCMPAKILFGLALVSMSPLIYALSRCIMNESHEEAIDLFKEMAKDLDLRKVG